MTENPCRKSRALSYGLLLWAVNLAIVATLFGVEYSAYNGSIEGTFIAIPRIMAKYPGEWSWWPFWNGGLPFEDVYLPFSHWLVSALLLLTGLSPGRAFHMVAAAMYSLGALSLYWMALALSRKLIPSFIAALAYSCISLSALLVPPIRADVGGMWNPRRLQDLVVYGESPHTVALALLPVAIWCLYRALTSRAARWKILAGIFSGAVALSNAFGIVDLAIAAVCLILSYRSRPWWRAPLSIAIIGATVYAWVSPWLSPSMIRAIAANAPTMGGDFRYTAKTWIGLVIAGGGFGALWVIQRRMNTPEYLRFFVLLAYFPSIFVLASYRSKVFLIPQPGRYEQEMDLFLMLALVFIGAVFVETLPRRARVAVAVVVLGALTVQITHTVLYARGLIRSVNPAQLSEYRVAKWLDRNRPGERAFISGSGSFWYNVFTDNPQLQGGHAQHTVNSFIGIVAFTIYSGMNAGERDAEYSMFWLKAFGAHDISVPGPDSSDHYKPFVHPRKFDGVLPLLWREAGDSIYEVPSRSTSLAHVIPLAAVVERRPMHGLDTAPVQAYVAALDDPRYPLARFQWRGLGEADIEATVTPGQVVSVQITYERGWEAWANGRRQPLRGDAIGQLVIEPDCTGPCRISLRYTGGGEHMLTRALSLTAILVAVIYGWFGWRGWAGSTA
jgi:hypothetical protein